MNFTEKPEIEAAAKWWSENICKNNQAAGDVKLNLAMSMFHCAPSLSDEDRVKFKEALKKKINKNFNDKIRRLGLEWDEKNPDRGCAHWTIGVDYGADPVLTDAAMECGIKVTNGTFPCKTNMWIKPNLVEVSAGYGGSPEVLFKG